MSDEKRREVDRRGFLTISGAVIGGIAAGTSVTVAESTERFLVDTGNIDRSELESAVDEIIHDIEAIDIAVVRGAESDLEGVTEEFEPDTVYELDLPAQRTEAPEVGDADVSSTSIDALFGPAQWDKQVQDIPEAHEITKGEGARVTILDTGIGTFFGDDVFHSDLSVNTDLSKNFTEDGGDAGDAGFHGTAVAGTVAAQGVGVLGTAPEAELVSCRVFSGMGGAAFGDIVAAMNYSVDIDADVANMSLGAYPVPREGIGKFYGGVLNRTTARANSNGTLLVFSAGNDSADLQDDGSIVSLPNQAANTVSVSATSPAGFDPLFGTPPEEPAETPASYTNYGTNVINVSAPGGDVREDGSLFDLVLTTAPPLNILLPYIYISGTSFSAPQVAGAAALVRSVDPDASTKQVRAILERNAVNANELSGDNSFHGRGFLDPVPSVKDASNAN